MTLACLAALLLASPDPAPPQPAPATAKIRIRPVEWAQPVLSPKLKNFHQLDARLYRSSQPDEDAMKSLAKAGISEILNLRDFHDDEDEAKGTALKLHRVELRAGAIKLDEVRQALKIITDAKGPVLVHCWHGSDRTGCICAFYRMVHQGWSKEQALAEMREGGYGFHECYDEIIKLIQGADIEALRHELKPKKPS
ncbi:MAG: hypothetical protein RL095_953 [Verrucomicrobiota bacterium]|jgi:protein tyrosine/serine phosphatase